LVAEMLLVFQETQLLFVVGPADELEIGIVLHTRSSMEGHVCDISASFCCSSSHVTSSLALVKIK